MTRREGPSISSPAAPATDVRAETVLDWTIEAVEGLEGDRAREVEALWRSDPHRSGFAAPGFLNVLIAQARAAGAEPFLARGSAPDGTLAALWPLERSASGELRLLQQRQGDHATGLAHPAVSVEALGEGLHRALAEAGARSIHLTHVPPWGPTLPAARVALERSGWPHRLFAATPCPVLAVEPGDGSGERLEREVERHRRVRSYTNRLKREPTFSFDAVEDDEGLAAWATAYADVHELRWDRTATPSEFCDPTKREFLLACLRGWARDGALVRFSISVDGKPISLAAAVRSGDRLVYHLVTTAPDGDPFRAGHVLIRLIGLWMAERGFTTFDFGEGDEGYKLRYANRDDRLWRLHGAPRSLSRRYLTGRVEERLRGSAAAQQRWNRLVNEVLRANLLHSLRTLWLRIAGTLRIYWNAPWSVRRGMLGDKFGERREILYHTTGHSGPDDPEVIELAPADALALMEDEQGVRPPGRADWLEVVRNGGRAIGVMDGSRAVAVCWMARASEVGEYPDPPQGRAEDAWGLVGAVTAPAARGRGLYRRTLEGLARAAPDGDPVWGHADHWNIASQRGLAKAGFRPFVVRVTSRGGEVRFEPWEEA